MSGLEYLKALIAKANDPRPCTSETAGWPTKNKPPRDGCPGCERDAALGELMSLGENLAHWAVDWAMPGLKTAERLLAIEAFESIFAHEAKG